MNSPEKITTILGKGFFSTSRTHASPKWNGTRCPEEYASPASMLHPSQMFYGNLSLVGTCKRSRSVKRSRIGIKHKLRLFRLTCLTERDKPVEPRGQKYTYM